MLTAQQIRERQTQLKQDYLTEPGRAMGRLRARGRVDSRHLTCQIIEPQQLNPAGMHLLGGGDGSFQCPVEIMLAGLVSCAGVTLAAVAHAMKIDLQSAEIEVTGDLDFRGTLAVDKTTPIALQAINVTFRLDSPASDEQIEKLLELTHRYCVVWRTLEQPAPLTSNWQRASDSNIRDSAS